ncbi:methyltransferase family protein [Marinomonas ostreistagni]|uniref:methyltransferase family protein n=1 Tax=Marinomonas ostreistagni TaxID=359209 RepID=UPI00194FE18A|nr:isoprenylcysteine carboxylmethyltransferase family protein [Marinomonas ostreistagni]MBM6550887.1 isoprenylcysteine carboxylmethyltransferase family protein [Marinomonas ostreistagni]
MTDTVLEFTRVYLACFYTFVALFYTVRIITFKRSSGLERVFHGQRYSANWWHHKIFGLFRVAIWMVCVWRVFFPSIDSYLGLLPGYENPWLLAAGDVCLTVGFAWAIKSHFALGQAWTSGVDNSLKHQLVTNGVYSKSRNPIYLGVLLAQVGFVLALPSVFSVVCLAFGVTTILRQTKIEEAHLERLHPESYSEYKQRVPRWV